MTAARATTRTGYRASFAQERMWFLDQLRPGATDYLVPIALRLRGPLDVPVLRRALAEIVARHEILRTRYVTRADRPVQVVDEPGELGIDCTDLSRLGRAERERQVSEIVQRALAEPFDLATQTPLRFGLVRLDADDHVLWLSIHHIACDGWSTGVLARELRVLYTAFAEGMPSPLEPLAWQYRDFGDWQREWLSGGVLERQVGYWRDRLAGLEPLALPTDRPRPRTWQPHGAAVPLRLPADLVGSLVRLGREHEATPFMVLTAAYQVLLSRHSGQRDIAVGTPIAGRNRSEVEGLVGFFANTLVLRADLSGEPSFATVLDRTRETALGAYAHQDLPFERLVDELRPQRDLSRNPLFQAMFVLQNAAPDPFVLDGLAVDGFAVDERTAMFDLTVRLIERPDGSMEGTIGYATALFDQATVRRLADRFLRLLTGIAAEPDRSVHRLEIMTDRERQQLVTAWNDTVVDRGDAFLPELFARQAGATPNATALIAGDERMSYAELADRADQVARALRCRGVGPETRVGICLERGLDLVVAMMGVLAAGGVLLPLDPDHPPHRRAMMVEDAGADIVLTSVRQLKAPDGSPPPEPLTGDHAAYVIYTSGSTGTPKGVVITHAGIRNRVLWAVERHGLSPADRVLLKTSIGFDAVMWEFLAPLVSGGCVVLAPPGAHRDPAELVRVLVDHDVTVLQGVPTTLHTLAEEPGLRACGALRLIFSAGEPLPTALCERLLSTVDVTLVNTYGPTECSIDATAFRYREQRAAFVPIGTPLDNTAVFLVDDQAQLVPTGVAGELCVAGVGLARGYLDRPAWTAERFVPNPFAATPGERLYRTGDLARRRADGILEFLGRLDHQLKMRGVRVEPGEIEHVLNGHPDIGRAVVAPHRDDAGRVSLVGYYVPSGARRLTAEQLLDLLRVQLPDSMVLSFFVAMEAFPTTASGKIDRTALPAPDGHRPDLAASYVPPRTPDEHTIVAVWRAVLNIDQIGVHDDFFALGGHSLLATRVVFRLRAAFGVHLPVSGLFEARTVARLATLVSEGDVQAPIVAVPRTEPLPLSFAQQRLWFLDRLEPGSVEYLVPIALRLRGRLDVDALRRAVHGLVERHEILRTRYVEVAGEPVQVIDPTRPIGLVPVDLTGDRVQGFVARRTRRPFQLDDEPPIRVELARLAQEDHVLVITLHHIVSDAWSMEILARELGDRYAGSPVPPPLPVQYADFAVWQRKWLDDAELTRQLGYWRDRLAGLTPVELPTDKPRATVREPLGDTVMVEVPAPTGRAIAELGRGRGATLFMTLLAAFKSLLARHTGQLDIAVGTPIAGRPRAETEELVGCFVNTLVLRTDLSGDPDFNTLLDRVRRVAEDASAHQDLPFERLVDELQPRRDLSRNPLFDIMFDLRHAGSQPFGFAGLDVEEVPVEWQVAKFDLSVSVDERPDGTLRCWFEYATSLFDRVTIDRMAAHYLRLLVAVAASPATPLSGLDILSPAEREQLLVDWSGVDHPVHERTTLELFEGQAKATPNAIAVTSSDGQLTYAELGVRANQLAHQLRSLGIGPESVVGVCMERSVDVVVVLLGVLRAGGVYLPLDPGHPVERLRFMVADADAQVVVTQQRFADRVEAPHVVPVDGDWARIARNPVHRPELRIGPTNLAYVIYTSGSTGQPKGVMIEHGSYANHCAVIARSYDIRSDDRVVLLSALTFDVAMDQMMATLLAGATVVVSDPGFWSPEELPDKLAEREVTIMEITPAYYREMLQSLTNADSRLDRLRLMNVGSDVVTVDDARRWAATGLPGRFLCNYGPTEATVTCLLHPVDGDPGGEPTSALPIGRPVPGTRSYILDTAMGPVPVGVPGELYLGGVRLARGYHRRAGLTADRFVPNPFGATPGDRLYRTGDLVRHRADGAVEFLGRIDQQVKIRGFRVELGEIEATLAQHPDVRSVAVAALDLRAGDRELVAYVVGAAESVALRAYLRERLPDHMVPTVWLPLDALPLTPSKKIDRKALPRPDHTHRASGQEYVPPRTTVEEVVAEIWREELGIERVGAHDDFFVLGGHSLLATRVLARLRQAFEVDVSLRLLFEATTVAELADAVRAAVEGEIARLSDAEVEELLGQEGDR